MKAEEEAESVDKESETDTIDKGEKSKGGKGEVIRRKLEAKTLSKTVIQLFRWQLPSSGFTHDCNHGLVAIINVAAHSKVE